ncbi:hypothetical protein ElyMa_001650500 [Elysia marginata]|uniref:Uncharacterized protein n=1 Tax=Elysia marginata TaxID=1093978 RepID=A0AAV4JP27_9GAST|nr:hypothetical protein ElyMa_001650500 [Elysia marginata]
MYWLRRVDFTFVGSSRESKVCWGGWSSPEREYRPCRDRSEGRASSLEDYDGYARTRYVSPQRRYRSRGEESYDPAVHCREYAGYESVRYTSPERECKPCGDRLE